MKVRVFHTLIDGQAGYDLSIIDEGATVQDYLDALNYFLRHQCPPCNGCTGCCWERVPLTYPDIYAYLKDNGLRRRLKGPLPPLIEFIQRFCYIYVEGPVVDISLGFRPDGACIFLDVKGGRCSLYRVRPLVCQTYICGPATRRATELRSLVVNAGMDELVRRWFMASRQAGVPLVMHEAHRPRPDLKDYPPGAFSGKEYFSEIPLKKPCPPGLWRELYKGAS